MIYLDHAATTPMVPEAVAGMTEALSCVGNASSLHTSGVRARRAVEEAREDIADALGARPSEVVFTAGGTESDNLAVKGIYWARAAEGRTRIVTSPVEHHAVMDAVRWLADHAGAQITWLEVDDFGRVHQDTLAAAVAENPADVALVTVMWANNEVGTVNPVRELAEVCTAHGVPLHTDAVQAVGQLPVAYTASGVDALTLTGHKLGGPCGAGALLLGRELCCIPLLHGGGQERDVRSGTLDVPSIVGLSAAVRAAVEAQPERATQLAALRDELLTAVRAAVPNVVLHGDPGTSLVDGGPSRLPGNAHLCFPGCDGGSLLMLLDARGIECSTGSACTFGVDSASHVLRAMNVDRVLAKGALRFSLGHTSTAGDVDALAEAIGPVVDRARATTGLTKTAR